MKTIYAGYIATIAVLSLPGMELPPPCENIPAIPTTDEKVDSALSRHNEILRRVNKCLQEELEEAKAAIKKNQDLQNKLQELDVQCAKLQKTNEDLSKAHQGLIKGENLILASKKLEKARNYLMEYHHIGAWAKPLGSTLTIALGASFIKELAQNDTTPFKLALAGVGIVSAYIAGKSLYYHEKREEWVLNNIRLTSREQQLYLREALQNEHSCTPQKTNAIACDIVREKRRTLIVVSQPLSS